jgi:hypothetical protein
VLATDVHVQLFYAAMFIIVPDRIAATPRVAKCPDHIAKFVLITIRFKNEGLRLNNKVSKKQKGGRSLMMRRPMTRDN